MLASFAVRQWRTSAIASKATSLVSRFASVVLDYQVVHNPNMVLFPQIAVMHISVSKAKGQLTDLVRRAEGGDEVVLTRHGEARVKLVPFRTKPTKEERRKAIEKIMVSTRDMKFPGPSAARSQDFLYNDEGMPG